MRDCPHCDGPGECHNDFHTDFAGIDPAGLVTARPSEAEMAAHQQRLESIAKASGGCLWLEQERA